MNQYVLPGTDLNVSGLCLGASPFGSEVEERDAFGQLDAFAADGGSFVDTARTYGQDHASERLLGKWMAERGNRGQIVVATKGGHETSGGYRRTLRYEQLAKQVDESLDHLRTDYIDLYYLHVDDRTVPVGEIIDLLDDKVKEGKIRCAGCSNWGADRIAEAREYAARTGKTAFAASEIEWSLAVVNHANDSEPNNNNIWMDGALYDFHRRTGLPVCAYSSQARGYFAKLDRFGEDGLDAALRRQYDSPRNRDMLKRLQKLSADTGVPVTVLAVAYMGRRKRDFFAVPIVSCQNREQLIQCMEADSCELTPAMIDFLEAGRYE